MNITLKPLVLCGPSGSGKSTLLKLLMEEFPNRFGFSVSHTTRSPRPGEEDGVHYHFTAKENMKQEINEGKFIEHAVFGGNMYGTSKKAVETVLKANKICILDIDVQGVQQVKESDLNPWYVFIKPLSMEALEQRLRKRNTETEQSLTVRLQAAKKEIEYGEIPGNFDCVIVNDVLDTAYSQLKEFITSFVLKAEN